MPKNLQSQIEKKLEKLQELLDNISEAQVIEPEEPETWDSDTLYNLTAELKAACELLADKKDKKLDDCGQPLILEVGILSLLDDWEDEKEAKENI